jgi:hypothetical protein
LTNDHLLKICFLVVIADPEDDDDAPGSGLGDGFSMADWEAKFTAPDDDNNNNNNNDDDDDNNAMSDGDGANGHAAPTLLNMPTDDERFADAD